MWRRMRGRLFWRIGGLFALLFLFTAGGCGFAAWLVAEALGAGGAPPRAAPAVLAVGGVFVLLFGAIGVLVSGGMLRRVSGSLDDVMEAAGRVAGGDYSARVRERGPREVRSLAKAFNAMASRLQVSDEQRRAFMADIAHELRTPLTVVQGQLEGLLDGVYPRDDEHLASALEETRLLSRLVEDLRTLALAEAGALTLQREPVDLGALVQEVVAAFQMQSESASIQLATRIADDLPEVNADAERIREVLMNLVGNALRYTPREGRIRLEVRRADGESVTVSVSDTGAGIAPEALPHIFDRFYKSPDSRGAGLGLAIAKNLVAAHGGSIQADSGPGQGTTIRFTLPVQA